MLSQIQYHAYILFYRHVALCLLQCTKPIYIGEGGKCYLDPNGGKLDEVDCAGRNCQMVSISHLYYTIITIY